ncbi:hypothetical protein OH786_35350 (plasmid) [Streptomyces atratus]|uniref:Uncharacterized protein n=2 Tax=Streptomyces atratus TaxID=1893 RepID=A0A1K1ZQT5_STRAR|nr:MULTISPECIES: hypothetical protein [Streptomyces]WSD66448.1 hypothetical protein OG978_02935 [Streptomyces sp. NBC_01591]SFX75837.1 hypothetical protein SAMN02787144_100620 [Streptomyces atratus]
MTERGRARVIHCDLPGDECAEGDLAEDDVVEHHVRNRNTRRATLLLIGALTDLGFGDLDND